MYVTYNVFYLSRYAKPSTVDNVLERLRVWYLEKEDDVRLLVSQIIYKLSNTAPDVLRTVHAAAVPLTLYGILFTMYIHIQWIRSSFGLFGEISSIFALHESTSPYWY